MIVYRESREFFPNWPTHIASVIPSEYGEVLKFAHDHGFSLSKNQIDSTYVKEISRQLSDRTDVPHPHVWELYELTWELGRICPEHDQLLRRYGISR